MRRETEGLESLYELWIDTGRLNILEQVLVIS